MVHLVLQESGAGDRTHLDFGANPGGAGLGNVALAQAAGAGEPGVIEHVGRGVFALGIEGLDDRRLIEEEADLPEAIELGLQLVVGQDCEIGGDDIQIGTGLKLRPEKVADGATAVVVANAW